MKPIAALAVAALMAGCTTSANEPPPFPTNYRETVRDHMRLVLFDPYSVRDAEISEPRPHRSLAGRRWNVCVRANAKNRFGGYTGLTETMLVLDGDRVTATDTEYAAITCRGASYSPFDVLTVAAQPVASPAPTDP